MGRAIKKGSIDQSAVVRIIDATDGTPELAVTSATAGLVLEYRRELGASTGVGAFSDLAALTTAHADGGIKHIGNGYYRVDVADAAFASGASNVLVHGGATGMVVIGNEYPLVDYDPQDAARLGLTALPAALVGGRIDASVGAVADNAITANAIASGAIDADALHTTAVDEIADGVLDEAIAEPGGVFSWAGGSLRSIVGFLGALGRHKITQSTTAFTLHNDAGTPIATADVTDSGSVFERAKLT